jgi:hypothetical protein
MFESNMLENMAEMQEWKNPWRLLVSIEFKEFLDSIYTGKKIVVEQESDDYDHIAHRLMK